MTYDPTATSPEEFIAELTRLTGFEATVRDARESADDGAPTTNDPRP